LKKIIDEAFITARKAKKQKILISIKTIPEKIQNVCFKYNVFIGPAKKTIKTKDGDLIYYLSISEGQNEERLKSELISLGVRFE
jgi:hypothetical protein